MKDMACHRPRYSKLGSIASQMDSVITRLMATKLEHPEILSLAAGFTDNALLPLGLVQETMELLAKTKETACLQYGMNVGHPGLRSAVIDLLQTYPGESQLGLDARGVMITNGSQQALYMLVQMTCDPGDIVLVEQPSYFVFLELLQGLGVRAVGVPVREDGSMDIEALAERVKGLEGTGELPRVKLMYLMGTFANPSTRCLTEEEKEELGTFMRGLPRPIPVVEDMAYRELYFAEPYPARSLLALEGWAGLPVFYLGTFTKPFATGMKTGFIVSRDEEALAVLAKFKGHQDFGSANLNQAIIERVLVEGLYPAHLEAIRAVYARKCRVLEKALRDHGLEGMGWTWESPQGGLLLWARGPAGIDTRIESPFHRASIKEEVLYVPGDLCFASGQPWNCVRLSFGALDEGLIPEAARRFCAAAGAVNGEA